jgi:Cyclic nucleotide-binding domain
MYTAVRARLVPVLVFGVLGSFGVALLDAASIGIFVGQLGASALPYAFIVAALVMILLGAPLARLGASPDRYVATLRLLLAFTAVVTAALGLGLVAAPATWMAFLSEVWWWVGFGVLPLCLWAAARRRFDIAESKDVLGLVGATLPVGSILGYAVVPLLVPAIGARWLLGASAVPLMLAAALFPWASAGPGAAPSGAAAAPTLPVRTVLRQPMVLSLLAFIAVDTAGTTILAYNYVAVAGRRFPDGDDVAVLVSVVLLVSSVLAVLVGSFLTAPVLRRYGVAAALALQGAVVGVATLIAGAMAFAGAALGVVLVAVVTARILDDALGPFSKSGARLLGRALPPDRREVANILGDGFAAPAALAGASIVLLLVRDAGPATIALLAGIASVMIVVVALVVRRGYPPLVREALTRRTFDLGDVVLDADAVAAVRRTLRGGSAPAISYGLDLLERGRPEELGGLLPELLGHPDERVRMDALARVERLERTDLIRTILGRLPYEGSTAVRSASVRTVAALRGADALEELAPALHGALPMRAGAIAGLLRSGDVEAVLAAGEPLLALLRSSAAADRRTAARILGDSGQGGLHRPLLALLSDADSSVVREALRAAAQVRQPRLWPDVVAALARPEVRPAAQRALAAGGADALPAVAEGLRADPGPDVAVALLGCSPRLGPQARGLVLERLPWALDAADARVGEAAVEALNAMSVRGEGATAELVVRRISADLDTLAQLIADAPPGDGPLNTACSRLRRRIALGIAALWALLQEPALASRVIPVVRAPTDPEQLSYAREAIETSDGPRALLREVAVAVTAASAGELRNGLAGRLPVSDGPALHRLFDTGLRHDVVLAGLALHSATPGDPGLLDAVGPDAPRLLAETAAILRTHPSEGRRMTPIEYVLALRGCEVFADAEDGALAALADSLTDRPVRPGELLFTEGGPSDTVFLVLDGLIVVGRDGRERQLASGELVGEAAAAEQAPHSATAIVREAGAVLAIPARALEELLAASPAVTRELLRRVARRAREAESGVAPTDDAMASILDRIAGTSG